jgi:hypothetical protein
MSAGLGQAMALAVAGWLAGSAARNGRNAATTAAGRADISGLVAR